MRILKCYKAFQLYVCRGTGNRTDCIEGAYICIRKTGLHEATSRLKHAFLLLFLCKLLSRRHSHRPCLTAVDAVIWFRYIVHTSDCGKVVCRGGRAKWESYSLDGSKDQGSNPMRWCEFMTTDSLGTWHMFGFESIFSPSRLFHVAAS